MALRNGEIESGHSNEINRESKSKGERDRRVETRGGSDKIYVCESVRIKENIGQLIDILTNR